MYEDITDKEIEKLSKTFKGALIEFKNASKKERLIMVLMICFFVTICFFMVIICFFLKIILYPFILCYRFIIVVSRQLQKAYNINM